MVSPNWIFSNPWSKNDISFPFTLVPETVFILVVNDVCFGVIKETFGVTASNWIFWVALATLPPPNLLILKSNGWNPPGLPTVLSTPLPLKSTLTEYSSKVLGSFTVADDKSWTLLILLRETPLNSYLETGDPTKWVLVLVLSIPLVIPVKSLPLTDVYDIISSFIAMYPGFVFETPTFSKVLNIVTDSIVIFDVAVFE